MSWSVSFIGTPEKIVEALEAHADNLSGVSQEEFKAALPHITGLLKQNFGDNYVRSLSANGHGTHENSVLKTSTVNVDLKNVYGVIV